MFVVSLSFSTNKARAPEFMEGHNAWIARGFADGVFLLTGNLQPAAGGAIMADGLSRAELEARLKQDPLVAEDVVRVDIVEITPRRTDPRLAFLAA